MANSSASPVSQQKPSTLRLFSSFNLRPLGVRYVDQDDDEEIVLFLRRSLITNIPWLSIGILALLLPLFLLGLLPFLPFPLDFFSIDGRYTGIGIALYYLLVCGYLLSNFLLWFYNLSIVTTKKMIDIDYYNLRNKNVAQAPLEAIEEVEFTQAGLLDGFFDFGDVIVQTQAEVPNFEFTAVPHPARVVDIVTDLIPEKGEH